MKQLGPASLLFYLFKPPVACHCRLADQRLDFPLKVVEEGAPVVPPYAGTTHCLLKVAESLIFSRPLVRKGSRFLAATGTKQRRIPPPDFPVWFAISIIGSRECNSVDESQISGGCSGTGLIAGFKETPRQLHYPLAKRGVLRRDGVLQPEALHHILHLCHRWRPCFDGMRWNGATFLRSIFRLKLRGPDVLLLGGADAEDRQDAALRLHRHTREARRISANEGGGIARVVVKVGSSKCNSQSVEYL
mmetsp:Transcript_17276/g.47510  ORF Transcript_17276/g.47510 Transcript_17276/m.47510 type:complete len:247 (+) Transcript_17276:1541-2281(+)